MIRPRLTVAPMRFGAGVKGKVNQSMAHGVPVVVTSIAAEGMHLVHEHNAMIADDPAALAHSISPACFGSRELWERLSTEGRANVREHFSIEAASRQVDRLLARSRAVVSIAADRARASEWAHVQVRAGQQIS